MPEKRLLPAMIVVSLAAFITGFVIHGLLLSNDYLELVRRGIFGGQELFQHRFPAMVAAYIAFGVGSVWIYSRSVSDKPWTLEGLRFGAALWLLYSVTSYLINFSVIRIPARMEARILGLELVDKLLLGLLIAFMLHVAARRLKSRSSSAYV